MGSFCEESGQDIATTILRYQLDSQYCFGRYCCILLLPLLDLWSVLRIRRIRSVRTMAAAQSVQRGSSSADVNLPIGRFHMDSNRWDYSLRPSPRQTIKSSERFLNTGDSIYDLRRSYRRDTRESTALDNFPLVQCLAQMSVEMNKNSSQIQQLISALELSKTTDDVGSSDNARSSARAEDRSYGSIIDIR